MSIIGMVWAEPIIGVCKRSKQGRTIVTACASRPTCPTLNARGDRCTPIGNQSFRYGPIVLLPFMLLSTSHRSNESLHPSQDLMAPSFATLGGGDAGAQ